jgi:hypothetical protein
LELARLARQATLLTRRAKSRTGETREELLDRVDARIRADIDGGLDGVAHTALEARGNGPTVQAWSPQAVVELDVRHEISCPTGPPSPPRGARALLQGRPQQAGSDRRCRDPEVKCLLTAS